MKRASLPLLVLACLMMVACEDAGPATTPRPTPVPTRPSPTVAERKRPRVVIESSGRTGALLAAAVRDLKTIGLWPRLTSHLYEIKLDSRSGTANVPEDGHLADAYFTGTIDDRGGGPVCDVMFFPSAVTTDLIRWRRFYAGGVIAEAPPTPRAFYGSLLAHELAHCRRGRRSEAVAQAWEARARRLLQARGM